MNQSQEQYKIKFRKHRGGLDESLKTKIEVANLEDVKNLFNDDFLGYEISDLICEYYWSDNRGIGYDETYIITAILGKERVVLGFSNGLLK